MSEGEEAIASARARQISAALARTWERIDTACQTAGRSRDAVCLLLATKAQPAGAIRAAIEAGASLIGENRVQELVAKAPALSDLSHQAHVIGPLQSNKVNATVGLASCIQTVDSVRLAERIAARAAGLPHGIDVMIQVNTSGESSKSGVRPALAAELAYHVAGLGPLRLAGFMTVGLNSDDEVAVGRSYAALREIKEAVALSGVPGTERAVELSMGMSGDLEIAIAEGATIVRLGTAIFGPRR
ncbi:MAG: YggS family pyridoxal phosphate-dependent enzyme [Bifidobacteriaceae bacterium]|jgi:pyridoxal phosphate enzyme (YggS family)|nr:YggS family pyridoxal phosphate-dependent enzyme [Bifidobacteriaceae bacterium]